MNPCGCTFCSALYFLLCHVCSHHKFFWTEHNPSTNCSTFCIIRDMWKPWHSSCPVNSHFFSLGRMSKTSKGGVPQICGQRQQNPNGGHISAITRIYLTKYTSMQKNKYTSMLVWRFARVERKAHLRHISGKSHSYLRHISDRYQANLSHISGKSQTYLWHMLEKVLGKSHILGILHICLWSSYFSIALVVQTFTCYINSLLLHFWPLSSISQAKCMDIGYV